MSPELIKAIRERIEAGQAKDVIKASVLAMGHAEPVFEAAYTLALNDLEKLAKPGVLTQEPELPSANELVKGAYTFVCKRLDLVALVLVPSLLFFGLSYASEQVEGPQTLVTVIEIAAILAFLTYLVAMFSVMYIASHEETPTYTEGLTWVRRNILSLLGVSILLMLVVFGGFILLLIPGIVLLVTLYFSQYALIIEGQKGVAALARSHALVKGRFFAIARKLLAFMLYLLLPIFLIAAAFEMISLSLPKLQKFTLAGDIGTEFVSALYTIVAAYAMSRLYRAMQVGRPLTDVTTTRKVIYWVLALLGVAAIAAAVVITLFFQTLLPDAVIKNSSSLQLEIQSTSLTAQLYALEHANSFKGVCDTLRPIITSADSVECNDNETAWAIMGLVGEERWCADTTTLGKEFHSSLEERFTCLIFPGKQQSEASNEGVTGTDSAEATSTDSETSLE